MTLGHRAVLSVIPHQLHGRNMTVYVDRFFTSAPLMDSLKEKDVYLVRTAKKNTKGFSRELNDSQLQKSMERGDSHYILAEENGESKYHSTIWMENIVVSFLCNSYSPTGDGSLNRKQKDGTRKAFSAPPCAITYNAYMGGVDRADQLRYNYGIDRKSRRWYLRIFWHLFDWKIAPNCLIIFNEIAVEQGERPMEQYDFCVSLVESLLGNYSSRKYRIRELPQLPPREGVEHEQVQLRTIEGLGNQKQRCRPCIQNRGIRQTNYGCKACRLPLCRPPQTCFKDWDHTQ